MGSSVVNRRLLRGSRNALIVMLLTGTAVPALVITPERVSAQSAQTIFTIPAGSLNQALTTFGRQSGLQVTYLTSVGAGKTSPGISGPATREQALAALLQGTGLNYSFPNSTTVTITEGDVTNATGNGSSAATLVPIVIQAQGETATGPVEGFVATMSSSATKTDTPILETPQSISVVTRDQVEIQGARRLEETLTYTPGVTVGSYGSNPEQDYVFMRGFQVPLYLDGTRQYRDYIVGAQLGVEPYGLERIEAVRGPSSVLYGQISPGGMVNQVVKRPIEEARREVQVTAGDPKRLQGAFDFSGPIDDEGVFLYRLTGLGRVADGQMDFQGDDRLFIAPSLTIKPDEGTRLTLFSHYHRDRDALRPVPLPANGTLFGNPNGELPRDRFLGEPDFDRFERDQFSLGYEFEHELTENWKIRQNLRYTYVDQLENYTLTDYFTTFPTDGRTVDRTGWHDVNKIGAFGADNQIIGEFETGKLSHKTIFGLDYSRTRSDWFFASATMSPIDAYDPVYGGPIGPLVPGISELKRTTQVGIYAQDQIAWENWLLTVGGRHDWAEGTTQDRLFGTTLKQDDNAFTGRIGLTYLFDNGLAPYASYSTSFDPETGVDSAGDPLQPTKARQYEIGIKYQPDGARSFLALSAFDLTRTNVLQYDPGTFLPYQIGEINVRGIEAEAKMSLTDRFDLVAAYTYLHSKVTEHVDSSIIGRPQYFTPNHQFSLWANYELEDGPAAGLGFGAGVRHRGKVWGLSYEIEVPSYTLFDAALTYDFGKRNPDLAGLNLTLNARNLFDRKYVSNCSYYEGCYYGDGRSLTATLKYTW